MQSTASSFATSSLGSLPKPTSAPGPQFRRDSSAAIRNSPEDSSNSPESSGESKELAENVSKLQQQFSDILSRLEALKKPDQAASKPKPKPKPKPSQSIVGSLLAATSRPSSSSGIHLAEDSDDDDDDDNGVAGGRAEAKEEESSARYASVVLSNATKNGSSVLSWVKAQAWKHSRNEREATALGAAIDALLAEGVDRTGDGIEILCRRLSGVHAADKFNNWKLCEVVEYPYASESLLDQRLLSRAVKDASALTRLQDRANSSSSKRGNKKNNNGNNNNYNNNKNSSSYKSKFGVGSSSAGAAQH